MSFLNPRKVIINKGYTKLLDIKPYQSIKIEDNKDCSRGKTTGI